MQEVIRPSGGWRKSSYSGTGDNCVEVKVLDMVASASVTARTRTAMSYASAAKSGVCSLPKSRPADCRHTAARRPTERLSA